MLNCTCLLYSISSIATEILAPKDHLNRKPRCRGRNCYCTSIRIRIESRPRDLFDGDLWILRLWWWWERWIYRATIASVCAIICHDTFSVG